MRQQIRKHYPDKLILYNIGNNDEIVHNQMECNDTTSNMYFSDLYDLWFGDQLHLIDSESVKATFLKGGYYRHDFRGETSLSVLSVNSIYFKYDNFCKLEKI
jgi:hypothetical protein